MFLYVWSGLTTTQDLLKVLSKEAFTKWHATWSPENEWLFCLISGKLFVFTSASTLTPLINKWTKCSFVFPPFNFSQPLYWNFTVDWEMIKIQTYGKGRKEKWAYGPIFKEFDIHVPVFMSADLCTAVTTCNGDLQVNLMGLYCEKSNLH